MENSIERNDVGVTVEMPVEAVNVVPLDCEKAFACLTEAEQKEIQTLANSIDVRRLDNVMDYGSIPLKNTFDQCGKFLKDERGSHADQEVIAQVIELSKKASTSYEDFNLVLQEPNLFQKVWLKVMKAGNGKAKSQTEKLQKAAITNYKLLAELKKSSESWLKMLQDAMAIINESGGSDVKTINLLERYIIAGKMAQSRVESELSELQTQYQETGLQQYAQQYDELKEGYDLFLVTMSNLEKSRIMYKLSIGQLTLINRSNRNVQIAIKTQVNNSMALIGQQLRNAVLNAKTREVLEGQKAIARLNDELIKDVSKTVGLTAEQTESLIYSSFYDVEAAKEAITTVINSCKAIESTANEMLPKMRADMTQLEGLVEELEKHLSTVGQKQDIKKIENVSSVDTKLSF